MNASDKDAFCKMVKQTFDYYGKVASPDTLHIYWSSLQHFATADVMRAFEAHIADPANGQYLPKVADIARAIEGDPEANCEAAYYQAVQQMRLRDEGRDKWRDPAAYWAATAIGAHDLLSTPYALLKSRWKAEYGRAKADIAAGVVPNLVPERRVALPAPGKASVDAATARKRIDAIVQRMLVPGGDPLRWAHRTLARWVARDAAINEFMVRQAMAALDITDEDKAREVGRQHLEI